MRRLLLLLVALISVGAIAACGSSSSSSPSGALGTELSYFPSGSPLVVSVVTDANSAAVHQSEALLSKFPIANLGKAALVAKLQQLGINYSKDVRPLFGNPIVLGLTGAPSHAQGAKKPFLGAWVTRDAGALGRVLKRLSLHGAGSYGSAKLFSGGYVCVAVDGSTVLVAGSTDALKAALDRHAHGGGISQSQFATATAGLPKDSLVQAFGNLSAVLSSPKAAKARQVPWIGAVRGYAASLTASASGVALDFKVDTSGSSITPAQLPIASGSTPPALAGTLPIQLGLRDPAQLLGFFDGAAEKLSPTKYGDFVQRQAALRRKTGVDLNSLLRLVGGDLIAETDLHAVLGRASVTDGAAAARTLAKLMSDPRDLFPHAKHVTRLPGGFYAIEEAGHVVTVGVAGNDLVAGKASVPELRAFAAAPSAPAAGAQGAVAFRISVQSLLGMFLRQAPTQLLGPMLGSLGDVTGWIRADPSGLTGRATLAVK